jgi:hypothetical protein
MVRCSSTLRLALLVVFVGLLGCESDAGTRSVAEAGTEADTDAATPVAPGVAPGSGPEEPESGDDELTCEDFELIASGQDCEQTGCSSAGCDCEDSFPLSIAACTPDGCVVSMNCEAACAADSVRDVLDCDAVYTIAGGAMPSVDPSENEPATPDPVSVTCGDGELDEDEECDDEGASETCNANCTLSECGDGDVNAAADEACDDGRQTATCDEDCTVAECGDGNINTSAGEKCDDGGPSAVATTTVPSRCAGMGVSTPPRVKSATTTIGTTATGVPTSVASRPITSATERRRSAPGNARDVWSTRGA